MKTSPSGFAVLGVPDDLCARLAADGIHEPFEIQTAVIPDALAGRDVCGRAPTGSGKTLAFGIPLGAGLRAGSNRRPTALVLAPTRELADQIANELRPLARVRNHAVISVYGGVGYGAQRKGLSAGAEVVVACPGRLEDLIASGDVRLDRVQYVVIDEADRMSDMGFLPAVRRILTLVPAPRQVQLFSATLDGAVAKLTAETQVDAVRHEVGPVGPDMTLAHHVFWRAERTERASITANAVRALGSTIVFTRTRHGADRLVKQLSREGVTAAPIHGGRSQPQRDRALRSFSKGEVAALVATDVAARGVHVEGVSGVVHFDPPEDGTTYVHRSGRTARAGASGTVVSLVDPQATRDAQSLQRGAGISVPITAVDLDALRAAPASRPAPARSEGHDDRSTNGATPSRRDSRRERPAHREHAERPARSEGRDRRERAALPSVRRDAPAARGRAGQNGPAFESGRRGEGTLAFFHGRRGYGFIQHGAGADLFVHHRSLPTDVIIEPGQRVAFEVREGRKGPEAFDVRPA
ncbi:DEAD/DEAH box helicase [soil metagenome]